MRKCRAPTLRFIEENQKHLKSSVLFCQKPALCCSPATPWPASCDGEADAHGRSGCSDSITACVRHTAKPSKSQHSAALIYKPHTLCTGMQASSESSAPTALGKQYLGGDSPASMGVPKSQMSPSMRTGPHRVAESAILTPAPIWARSPPSQGQRLTPPWGCRDSWQDTQGFTPSCSAPSDFASLPAAAPGWQDFASSAHTWKKCCDTKPGP